MQDSATCGSWGDHITGESDSGENPIVVSTRLFYNSKLNKREAQGLIARGNKRRLLRAGNIPHSNKHRSGHSLRDIGKCKNKTTISKTMVYSRTPPNSAPPSTESGSRDNNGGDLFPLVAPASENGVRICKGVTTPQSSSFVSGHEITPFIDRVEVCDNAEPDVGSIVVDNSKLCNNVPINVDTDTNARDKVLLFDINNTDDKYLNVTGKKRLDELLKIKGDTNIDLFNQWRKQSDFDFGFVPLSEFILPDRIDLGADNTGDPLEVYKRVKDSGKLNFMGCRIPVNSNLNISAWQEMLKEYWDVQLIELLKFGFPDPKKEES